MANEQAKVKADLNGLNELLKSLKQDYFVRIGIIGAKAKQKHKNSNLTKAELGTIHEQPDNDGKKIPKRSFLEMPLKLKLNFNDAELKELKKSAWTQIFLKKKPKEFFAQLGAKALDIVTGAFETNGYGEWQPWSKGYERKRINEVKGKKKREQFWLNHNILTYTGELRNKSIEMKVLKRK